MMAEQIVVYVNDMRVRIYEGMQVKHALISCDESLYRKACREELFVEDENGFQIDLEGALEKGARIYTREIDH